MKVGLTNYRREKSSELPWAPSIPMAWKEGKLKHIKARKKNSFVDGPFGSNLKSEHFTDDGEVFVIESGFATQGNLDEADLKTITADHFATISRSEAVPGDIIIAKIGAYFGLSNILPPLSKPAVVSGNSLKLSVDEGSNVTAYVHYLLLFLKSVGTIDLLASTTAQPALTLQGLNALRIVIPPRQDQLAIATFLDRETAKIDRLMAVRQKQVERLQEQRTAVIHHAVTKGLDPLVRMKSSGVEWLGDVPDSWETGDLKHFARFSVGWTPPTGQDHLYDGDFPWCTIGDLSGELIIETEKSISAAGVASIANAGNHQGQPSL